MDEKSVVVKLNNKKIKPESLGNNNYKFVVESGYKSSFEIEANDYAKNSANIYKINDLTVSTNIFVRWYAHTLWFWLPVGLFILIVGTIIFLIIRKKIKENEE